MINKETIRDCFNLLEAEYGKQTAQKKELWSKMLKEYTDEELEEAVIKHIRTGEFFPRISNIIEIIEGTVSDEAEKAWIILKKKIEEVGGYESVSFPENPIIGKVVEDYMGGWIRISDMKIEEEKWIRKDFVKYYQIVKNDGDKITPQKLPGIFEIENNKKGYSEEYMLEKYGRYLDGTKVKEKKLLKEKKDGGILNEN